jgi:acyl-CoA thioesterase FadM
MRLRVWPNDIDVIGHMNNGRYMTIIDLALIEYLTRAGVLKALMRKGWRPMLGGSMISFSAWTQAFSSLHTAIRTLVLGRTLELHAL